MRVDVKKFLFLGSERDLEFFLRKAQEAGFVHFIDPEKGRIHPVSEEIKHINDALKVLRELPPVNQEEPYEGYHIASEYVTQILSLKDKLETLKEELRIHELDIQRVAVFGNFNLEDVKKVEKDGQCKFQYFCSSAGAVHELPENLIPVGKDQNLDYFVAINPAPRSYDRLTEILIEKPVGQLRKERKEIATQIHDLEQQLRQYAKYDKFLHHYLFLRLNDENRGAVQASARKPLDGALFSVEGWVPVNRIQEIPQMIQETNVIVDEVALEPTDVIPTCLDNVGPARVGEDLVHIYDTPSNTDKDPSLWVLSAFTLFFAMIVGDFGYGFVLFLIVCYLWYRFPHAKEGGRRFLKLATILTIGTMVWGTLSTSFFSLSVPLDSPFRKISLIQYLTEKNIAYHMQHKDATYQELVKQHPELKDAKTPLEFLKGVKTSEGQVSFKIFEDSSRGILLELALLVGVVHIILSMARYLDRNYSAIGWIILMIGGYLYLPSFVGAPTFVNYVLGLPEEKAHRIGLQLMYLGFALAMVIAVVKHKLLGLTESMHVIQIFADVLSYLRIYALGLAGVIMGETINGLAEQVPLFFAVFIVALAHLCNIGLGVMGAVIHGLRLNFLEWYHYSFEGGGRRFNPLKLFKVD